MRILYFISVSFLICATQLQSCLGNDVDVQAQLEALLIDDDPHNTGRTKLLNIAMLIAYKMEFWFPINPLIADFEKLLADPIITGAKTEQMQAYVRGLNDILEDLRKKKSVNKTKYDISDITKKLYAMGLSYGKGIEAKDTATADEKLIRSLINRYVMGRLEAESFETLKGYFKVLQTAIEIYLEGLTEKDRQQEQKMIEWYPRFKNELDMYKKLDLFGVFIKFF